MLFPVCLRAHICFFWKCLIWFWILVCLFVCFSLSNRCELLCVIWSYLTKQCAIYRCIIFPLEDIFLIEASFLTVILRLWQPSSGKPQLRDNKVQCPGCCHRTVVCCDWGTLSGHSWCEISPYQPVTGPRIPSFKIHSWNLKSFFLSPSRAPY